VVGVFGHIFGDRNILGNYIDLSAKSKRSLYRYYRCLYSFIMVAGTAAAKSGERGITYVS
jgi:hypothetical protein